jgi:uncharacterized short protein YbdD (DUF466 family)
MLGRRAGGQADGRTGVTLHATLLRTLRSIAGMPDYDRHIEHLRRCHPDQEVPTRKQFYEEFVRTRYGEGTTRCC